MSEKILVLYKVTMYLVRNFYVLGLLTLAVIVGGDKGNVLNDCHRKFGEILYQYHGYCSSEY